MLVDHTDNDLMTAFRVMLQLHNNKQARLKVTDETLMLPMDNSFSVGTASMYSLQPRLHQGNMLPGNMLPWCKRGLPVAVGRSNVPSKANLRNSYLLLCKKIKVVSCWYIMTV